MKDKKYFCYEIFKNIAVWSINGRIGYSPCSFYKGYFETSDQINLTKAWNSDGRKKIIELVNQDQPVDGCRGCYQDESRGMISRRLHPRSLTKTGITIQILICQVHKVWIIV